MLLKMIAVSIIGGCLCLDRICLQLMLSRPVVIGPLTGFMLGDLLTGLYVGALLELLWIDKPQIGIAVPPNDSLVAVMVVASLLLAYPQPGHQRQELVVFAFLIFIPLGYVTQKIDCAIIRANEDLSEKALQAAEGGDVKGIERQHSYASLRTLIVYVLFLFFSTVAGVMIIKSLFPALPEFVIKACELMYGIIPIVLIAVCLNTIKLRKAVPVFCALFLVTMIILELVHAF